MILKGIRKNLKRCLFKINFKNTEQMEFVLALPVAGFVGVGLFAFDKSRVYLRVSYLVLGAEETHKKGLTREATRLRGAA